MYQHVKNLSLCDDVINVEKASQFKKKKKQNWNDVFGVYFSTLEGVVTVKVKMHLATLHHLDFLHSEIYSASFTSPVPQLLHHRNT